MAHPLAPSRANASDHVTRRRSRRLVVRRAQRQQPCHARPFDAPGRATTDLGGAVVALAPPAPR